MQTAPDFLEKVLLSWRKRCSSARADGAHLQCFPMVIKPGVGLLRRFSGAPVEAAERPWQRSVAVTAGWVTALQSGTLWRCEGRRRGCCSGLYLFSGGGKACVEFAPLGLACQQLLCVAFPPP